MIFKGKTTDRSLVISFTIEPDFIVMLFASTIEEKAEVKVL